MDSKVTFNRIEQIINDIEWTYPDPFPSEIGRMIFVCLKDIDTTSHVYGTKFYELTEVTGRDRFSWIAPYAKWNEETDLIIQCVRKPKKKEFKDALKVTPPNCFVYEKIIPWMARDINGCTRLPRKSFDPVVQTMNKDPAKAIKFLGMDKFYCPNLSYYSHPRREGFEIMSEEIQRGIDLAYDFLNMWALCYQWNGMCFAFCVEYETLKELLKGREKVAGRKPTIPHVVKQHERAGRTIPQHFRMTHDIESSYLINGRRFSVLLNPDLYETTAFNYERGKERMGRWTSGEPDFK